jgi:hypothetical protein
VNINEEIRLLLNTVESLNFGKRNRDKDDRVVVIIARAVASIRDALSQYIDETGEPNATDDCRPEAECA